MKGFVKGYIAGLITLLIFVAAIYGCWYVYKSNESATIDQATGSKVEVLKTYIDQYYLEEYDEEDMANGIYKGLVESLGDPYSTYYTAEEFKELMISQSGEYCGIGVVVSQSADTMIVNIVTVYEGSPAEEAGLKAGDVIYKVKGEEVSGESLDNVVAQIRGEEGTTVDITVYREKTNEYIDTTVKRRTIVVPTIEYEMLDDGQKIGYISIGQFEMNTDELFEEAMNDLMSQGMKSIIFDVRSNPGGLYDSVCNMLDMLLPEGTLVYTMDKYDVKDEVKSDADCIDIPMAVLINGDSASASEIFAGAIQDYGAGEIIGTQSFGKGIVQSVVPLSDGSAIKLTISKYYTPNGVNIHGTGITPDIELEIGENDTEDVQLKKAVEILSK